MRPAIKIVSLLLALLSCLGALDAQNRYIDSLGRILKQKIHDTTRLKILAGLSEICAEDQIAQYALPANDLARKLLVNSALTARQRERVLQHHALALNNLGFECSARGNVKSALDYYHQSLSVREKLDDHAGIATALTNIAVVHQSQLNAEKALQYLLRAVVHWKKTGNKTNYAVTLSSIGTIHLVLKRDSLAFFYTRQALDMLKGQNDPEAEGVAFHTLAQLYAAKNDTAEARRYFTKSLQLSDSVGDLKGICDNRAGLAKLKLAAGKYKEAQAEMKTLLQIAKDKGIAEVIRDADKVLYDMAVKDRKYDDALMYFTDYIMYRDSIQNHNNRKKLFQKELEYEFEKKEAALELKRQKELADSEREKQQSRMMMTMIGAVAISSLAVAGVIFRSLRITRSQKKIIEHQKVLVEEKRNEMISSINYAERIQSALLAGDEVWKRISKDYFILFKPKDIVSGDFYWAHTLPNGRAVFILADCTGHGVPGGFMSMLGISFLNEIVVENKIFSAAEILNRMRAKVIHALEQKGDEARRDGMDAAVCVWNRMNNTLEFAGANNGLLVVINGEVIEVPGNKMPIGRHTGNDKPFESLSFELHSGDSLYLYTDGFADQFGGPKGKKYKYKQLNELLASNSHLPAAEQKQALMKTFNEWKGNLEQVDDVAVIGIRV